MAGKERLMVYDHNRVFRIGWYFPEDNDIGATLGEDYNPKTFPKDDDEHTIATRFVLSLDHETDTYGFYWESEPKAKRILKMIKDRLKNKEYPEWAKKALAEGWTPPKNWKA